MSEPKWTPGPWRWECRPMHHSIELCGGRPQYDLTILQPVRWGMGGASMRVQAHDGTSMVGKAHEWQQPIPGREHHARWIQTIRHPDLDLIAAAPELYEALESLLFDYKEEAKGWTFEDDTKAQSMVLKLIANAEAAMAKARGETEGER